MTQQDYNGYADTYACHCAEYTCSMNMKMDQKSITPYECNTVASRYFVTCRDPPEDINI